MAICERPLELCNWQSQIGNRQSSAIRNSPVAQFPSLVTVRSDPLISRSRLRTNTRGTWMEFKLRDNRVHFGFNPRARRIKLQFPSEQRQSTGRHPSRAKTREVGCSIPISGVAQLFRNQSLRVLLQRDFGCVSQCCVCLRRHAEPKERRRQSRRDSSNHRRRTELD